MIRGFLRLPNPRKIKALRVVGLTESMSVKKLEKGAVELSVAAQIASKMALKSLFTPKPSLHSGKEVLLSAPHKHLLPRGVMVTQEILILSFKVRVLAG